MGACLDRLRQFRLLLWKDWVLIRRNKLWTIFEIVIPLALILPIVIVVLYYLPEKAIEFINKEIVKPGKSFQSINVRGEAEDFKVPSVEINIPQDRWCGKESIKFAYYGTNVTDSENIIRELLDRYPEERTGVKIVPHRFNDEDQMVRELKADIIIREANESLLCHFKEYAFGVSLYEFDTATARLHYKFFVPERVKDDWDLSPANLFIDPFGSFFDFNVEPIPRQPPFYQTAFVTFQHALDSIFIHKTSGRAEALNETVILRRWPKPKVVVKVIAKFIRYMPILWAILVFLNLLHTGREIAAEKSTTKPFLSAMGLSAPFFYLSHITFGFLKFFIVSTICLIPLMKLLTNTNFPLIFITVELYGLGAITLAAMIASIFKTSNTTIKVILIAWILLVVAMFKAPQPYSKFEAYLASLNVNTAFHYASLAIGEFMNRGRVLTLTNMFEDSRYLMSCGEALLMILFDIVWMYGLTIVFDLIFGQPDFSFRNLFKCENNTVDESELVDGNSTTTESTSNRRRQEAKDGIQVSVANSEGQGLLHDSNETDGGRERGIKDIEVKGLIKVYSSTGERAVNGLSLTGVRGEISCLLGHNGAGKSTTFSSIAGTIAPTAGQIKICGKDVSTQRHEARKHIGLCPQFNPLYEKLTVKEHLELIHGLKGADKKGFKDEARYLLQATQLYEKRNEKSMNLSGGMKRKLCVCMSLIGKSKVVLLDEPTAGMDPGARKNVQELLEKEKKDRTILLTTHYMDEAERLGDWVFIMSHGQLVASGSNQYLKRKFGSGYLLTVVVEEESGKLDHEKHEIKKNAEKLLKICQRHCPDAEVGEIHGKQIQIVLPEKDKDRFVGLFEELEELQNKKTLSSLQTGNDSLHIGTFGLSLNTLEQVFIKIGELAESTHSTRSLSSSSSGNQSSSNLSIHSNDHHSYTQLIESQGEAPDKSRLGKVIAQFRAIWKKRFIYMCRNWPQLITQLVAPLAILWFASYLANIKKSVARDSELDFTLHEFGLTRIPILMQSKTAMSEEYYKLAKEAEGSRYVPIYNSSSDTLESIVEGLPRELPAHGLGAAFYSSHSEALFHGSAKHAVPTTINAWNTARLRSLTGGGIGTIEPQIMAYTLAVEEEAALPKSVLNYVLAPLLLLALSLLTSTFVMYLVEERSCRFAHQQSLSGISPITYWTATFLYDFAFYLIAISIFLGVFWACDWLSHVLGYLFLVWIIYFLATIPFVYCVSYLFSSSSKANVLLIIWQVLAPISALIIFAIFMYTAGDGFVTKLITTICLILLPSYAMSDSAIILAFKDVNSTDTQLENNSVLSWKDGIGRPLVCMLIFAILATVLFLILQFKAAREKISHMFDVVRTRKTRLIGGSLPFDIDHESLEREKRLAVEAEMECRKRDEQRKRGTTQQAELANEEFVLIVHDLVKKYGSLAAINELYLAVQKGECFGLLGVNGAGKTTTFNVLTGQTFATSGNARINGRDVTQHIPLGYCPQFDALLLDLTGRETLEILAQMHGYSNYKEKAKLVLESVGMTKQGNKLIRYYSGGQKRKLSVGVALLAPATMIILDEPTAGIDPRARREIWELILGVRHHSHSAVMLTSHSMDECEALCSRIAVLNRGKLIAIGESQTLKSRYGGNYTLTMTAPSTNEKEMVKRAIETAFPESIMKSSAESKALELKWMVPKRPDDKWSKKFAQVQQLVKQLNVQDYCLAQSSLEDAFLRLSEVNDDSNATPAAVDPINGAGLDRDPVHMA